MKKLSFPLVLVAIIALVGLGVFYSPQLTQALDSKIYYSVCDNPVTYRIGTIDQRFNLTGEALAKDIEKASQIWNSNYPKPLIVYDPASKLSINMVYDTRQSLTNKIGQIENNLQTQDQNLKPQAAEYEKRLAEFKNNVAQLNSDIESWNQKGGAPIDEYEKLKSRQQALQQEATELNSLAQSLNHSAQNYNADVNQLNSTIGKFNETLQYKPEEGLFDPGANTINIYFNISQNELVHTLAHELGHAIGLTHVSNPNSIMYTQTNNALRLSTSDLEALNNLCKTHSIFENLANRVQFLVSQYSKQH